MEYNQSKNRKLTDRKPRINKEGEMKKRHLLANALLLALGMTLLAVQAAPAATITVTTANDVLNTAHGCDTVTLADLPGTDFVVSLREAICVANNNAGPDNIYFNIPGPGTHTIDVSLFLPPLTDDATTINGYTQPGAYPNTDAGPATIRIEIDGTGINNNGLNVTSSGNVIRGLAIFGFLLNEIAIFNYEGRAASYNLISGSYLGTHADGVSCPPTENRGLNGVFIGLGAHHNLIGGGLPPNLNLISCNGYEGVGIHGSGTTDNTVSANYIGTDPLGTTSRGNTWDGVRIYGGAQNNTIGGATWGERNVISGNVRDGVRIVGAGTTGNRVLGNYIGLEPDGVGDRSNDYYGVHLLDGAQDNTIGGDRTAGEGNVISGNLVGVVLSGTRDDEQHRFRQLHRPRRRRRAGRGQFRRRCRHYRRGEKQPDRRRHGRAGQRDLRQRSLRSHHHRQRDDGKHRQRQHHRSVAGRQHRVGQYALWGNDRRRSPRQYDRREYGGGA